MHEVSIMEAAVKMAVERAREAGASRICEIRLRIGVLSGVVPEALQFAFETLTAGTLAEKASLCIDTVAARFWCPTCQREFEAATFFAACPGCGVPSRDLRAGRELELASMEVE